MNRSVPANSSTDRCSGRAGNMPGMSRGDIVAIGASCIDPMGLQASFAK